MTAAALTPEEIGDRRRWAMLAVSTFAQAAAGVTIHGPAFLIPVLIDHRGLSLTEAGTVAAMPLFGVMATLVLWGFAVDHVGEKVVLLAGLGGTFLAGVGAALVHGTWPLAAALFLAGAAAASTASASGRVVVGWFPPARRGLAMGIRQMAQPLGVGIAAVSIAVLADRHGIRTALAVPALAAVLALAAVALVILDPPRPERTLESAPNPYRADSYLTRIHAASILLVVPQFLVWTFALVWLLDERGWEPPAAGLLVAGTQILGALGRIASGQLSDMVRSRMRPTRWVAVAAAVTMALLGLTAGLDWGLAVALLAVATVVTVADNGLSFTAVAERAGPFWSGRSLGIHNTAQYATAAACAPLAAACITETGYAWTFALAALFPVLAVGLVPVEQERPLS